jgi:hypothetical protein
MEIYQKDTDYADVFFSAMDWFSKTVIRGLVVYRHHILVITKQQHN